VVISAESSVGSGVRRVEALVGIEGFRSLARDRARLAAVGAELKAPTDAVVERVAALQARVRDLERELGGLRTAALTAGAGALAADPTDVSGVAFVGHAAPEGTPGGAIRTLALDIRGRMPAERAAVVAVGAVIEGKANLVVALNDQARAWGHKAGELVLTGCQLLGGRGGGKDDVAQGGGPAGERLAEALTAVEHFVGARATGSA
jgi:alanyl-tRNA synthetase